MPHQFTESLLATHRNVQNPLCNNISTRKIFKLHHETKKGGLINWEYIRGMIDPTFCEKSFVDMFVEG